MVSTYSPRVPAAPRADAPMRGTRPPPGEGVRTGRFTLGHTTTSPGISTSRALRNIPKGKDVERVSVSSLWMPRLTKLLWDRACTEPRRVT